MRQRPPFRADMVGSLLRTARLKEARARKAAGTITAEQLRAIEDEEITALIAAQEAIGLQAVTDGEFRRSWWHYDFFQHLRRRRDAPGRAGHPVRRRADPRRGAARCRQDRFRRPPLRRAFPFREGAHDEAAEDSPSPAHRCCTTAAAAS